MTRSCHGADIPDWVLRTQQCLGQLISTPKLTARLLSRPPFRFLHDIVLEVQRQTDWAPDLFDPERNVAGAIISAADKAGFLTKAAVRVSETLGVDVAFDAAAAISGRDAQSTNEFLQLLALAASTTSRSRRCGCPQWAGVGQSAPWGEQGQLRTQSSATYHERAGDTPNRESFGQTGAYWSDHGEIEDVNGEDSAHAYEGAPGWRCAHLSCRFINEDPELPFCQMCARVRRHPSCSTCGASSSSSYQQVGILRGTHRRKNSATAARTHTSSESHTCSSRSSSNLPNDDVPVHLGAHGFNDSTRNPWEVAAELPRSAYACACNTPLPTPRTAAARAGSMLDTSSAPSMRRNPPAAFGAALHAAAASCTSPLPLSRSGSRTAAELRLEREMEQRHRQRAAYEARADSRAELRGMPRRPGPRSNVRRPVPPSDEEWEAAKAKAAATALAAEEEADRERLARVEDGRMRREGAASHDARGGDRSGDAGVDGGSAAAGEAAAGADDASSVSSDEDGWYREELKSRARLYEAEQSKREAKAAAEAAAQEERQRHEHKQASGSPRISSAEAALSRQRSAAAWVRFAAKGVEGQTIRMADIPWPALEPSALGLELQQGDVERKKAFREQSLRWHPDRFVQGFGALLHESDREAILRKVTEVSQAINALFQEAS